MDYAYIVTCDERKQKIRVDSCDVSSLEAKIRNEFSISADKHIRMQMEDQDYPGEWVDLTAKDTLPTKAKINVNVLGKTCQCYYHNVS